MIAGTIVKRLDRGFVMKVIETGKAWAQSKAKNPSAAVGKEIKILIKPDVASSDRWKSLVKKHMKLLKTLKTGDRVTVEAFHLGGDHLVIMEVLRKSG